MTPTPGMAASVALEVGIADLATTLRSGDVAVLATPRLLALCEEATMLAVAGSLPPGETTVGTRVELQHLAPSLPGTRVEAAAVLTAVAERRLTFHVEARAGGRVVAQGVVERVVVERARFPGEG